MNAVEVQRHFRQGKRQELTIERFSSVQIWWPPLVDHGPLVECVSVGVGIAHVHVTSSNPGAKADGFLGLGRIINIIWVI